ncbi:MAG: sugar phosphate isomerase/epimerase [Prevotella sp.]|jgi:sugar phosphate isomerase/epimerase|nr:sugar phosphate isomerase/epimerase [Prevotella sp.]
MTTRRNFLRNSALCAAAMATAPAATILTSSAATTVNREVFKPLRLSVLSYSFKGLFDAKMMDIFHYIETCKYRYGLDAADMWAEMFTSTDDEFIRKIHSVLEDEQLVIPNIAVDGAHIMASGDEDPNQLRAKQDLFMSIAKRLGIGFLRLDAGPVMRNDRKEEDGWTNQEFDFIVKRYKELAQIAYDNGFKVGAENHWGPERHWIHMEKLIKAVDHPGFGICVHFGSWRGTPEENIAAEKSSAPWIAHTHIPWDVCESPDLPKRLSVLHDLDYQGYYSVEHHSQQNEYNLVGVQLDKVKAVLTSWNHGRDGNLNPPRQRDSARLNPW